MSALRLIVTVFCLVAGSSIAVAQVAYPTASVRIIVPFTPGTGIDILARTLGQKMGDDFKQPVIVDNRPGASGNIGTEAAAKAAPDGHTLLMTANTIVLNRSLFKSIPYDPIKDFVPVAPLAIGRLALVTNPSIGVRTVGDFVALAKREPGKLNYGSPGNGTPHHLRWNCSSPRRGSMWSTCLTRERRAR
jgi:tripartite-type tricarboxylate transporter receptor subunit TctC